MHQRPASHSPVSTQRTASARPAGLPTPAALLWLLPAVLVLALVLGGNWG